MLPLEMFRSRTFSATNVVTFGVYAALAGVFFFVVINLQVVAGFSPLAAGMALLPVTVIMLLLSARAGALAGRIGPRLPMTLGPLVCAVGVLLLSRIGAQAAYTTDVLPAVIVVGLGLSLTVAPLTSTALASAQDRHAGVASGVNNAVARTAGLLAIAILPLVSGVGSSFTDPETLGPAYRTSMLICAALLLAGGALSFATIPSSFAAISAQVAATHGVAAGATRAEPVPRALCGHRAPAAPKPRTRQQEVVARDSPSSGTGAPRPLQAAVDRLAAAGYGLVGGIGQYEHLLRMAYVRGPEGIVVSLARVSADPADAATACRAPAARTRSRVRPLAVPSRRIGQRRHRKARPKQGRLLLPHPGLVASRRARRMRSCGRRFNCWRVSSRAS